MGESYKLLQIRNPWGNSREWNGDWSDKCPKWELLTISEKGKYHSNLDDGTFWMSWEDFREIFIHLYVSPLDMNIKRGSHKQAYDSSKYFGA